MKNYMQTMASVIDGSHTGEVALEYFDAKYVNVYRNNSLTAHIDVLRANYKTVAALVGEEFFAGVCLEYIKACPARTRTLVGYGEHFAQMLDDNVERHQLAYLSSFAKLDRAWTLAHTAKDTQPLEISTLEEIIQKGGDLENFKMPLVPSAALIHNDWPVFSIWSALRNDTEITDAIELTETPENILVWRHGQEVMYRDLNAAEFAFLEAIRDGGNLGLATVKTLEAGPATDIGQLLAGMVAAELFIKGGFYQGRLERSGGDGGQG